MLKVTVISVGKLKEKHFLLAADEYIKRLKRYASVNEIEIKDLSAPDTLSESEKLFVIEEEGRRIKEKIPKGAYIIALCVEGKALSSEELSDMIKTALIDGVSSIVFIIGGSLGLSDEIKRLADLRLSFSRMTFPHMLMKVILLEQVYRAFTIIEGKTYHK